MDMGKVVLDDRVADDVSLSGQFACRIAIKRNEAAFVKAMQTWNFSDMGDGLHWVGVVPGPDRLRFMGMTSRYVALISDFSLAEAETVNVSASEAVN
jgi:ABC-2 type transport system ATP-binding protein